MLFKRLTRRKAHVRLLGTLLLTHQGPTLQFFVVGFMRAVH
jgi:hypothetical protein